MHFFHYDISKYLKDGIQKSIHGNVAKQVALNRKRSEVRYNTPVGE